MKTPLLIFSAVIAVMTGCKNADENTNTAEVPPVIGANSTETAINLVSMPMTEGVPALVTDSAAIRNMTPGPQHKELAASVGKWATEMTYWSAEGAAPSVSKGTCEIKMVLGGRYQQAIYKGEANGVPYEGIGYVAFDNAKKMYVNTWVDNMSTGILYLEGGYNPNMQSTEMIGKCMDPATCHQKGMRQVTRNIDANTQVMEMYETPDGGKEFKSMEIKLAKK